MQQALGPAERALMNRTQTVPGQIQRLQALRDVEGTVFDGIDVVVSEF